jgi:hypothetical protein
MIKLKWLKYLCIRINNIDIKSLIESVISWSWYYLCDQNEHCNKKEMKQLRIQTTNNISEKKEKKNQVYVNTCSELTIASPSHWRPNTPWDLTWPFIVQLQLTISYSGFWSHAWYFYEFYSLSGIVTLHTYHCITWLINTYMHSPSNSKYIHSTQFIHTLIELILTWVLKFWHFASISFSSLKNYFTLQQSQYVTTTKMIANSNAHNRICNCNLKPWVIH